MTDTSFSTELIALRDEVFKQNNEFYFKPIDKTDYGQHRMWYEVYFANEPNIELGKIGYLTQSKTWWISSQYRATGRWIGAVGEHGNTSVHMKNIVKKAKDLLVMPNFEEYIKHNYMNAMHRHIRHIQNKHNWEINSNTYNIPEAMFADLFKLHDMGYKPISLELKEAIDYIVQNQAEHEKSRNYNPEYYNVWIKSSEICYQKFKDGEPIEPTKFVKNKNELPESIHDKVVILDLLEVSDDIHEDIGCKEKPNFYSVFV